MGSEEVAPAGLTATAYDEVGGRMPTLAVCCPATARTTPAHRDTGRTLDIVHDFGGS